MEIVDRKNEILPLLCDLVSLKSKTGTCDENLASDFIYDFLSNLEYFKKYPIQLEQAYIPDDPLNRSVVYGIIQGNSNKTVILSGHFDVVDELDYKDAGDSAFDIGSALMDKLKHKKMNPLQKEDMESDNWLWGRGVCDMKGGLSIHIDIIEEFSTLAMNGELDGTIVFMWVCDEESYSQGMRFGVKILSQLKEEYKLDYKLLINPEPTDLIQGRQIMSIGSVGKLMPVVVVQGVTSHIGHCFDGFNPLNLLSKIYDRTNGCLEFSDSFSGEASMPPTWIKFRDLKDTYDASIPFRAGGYFTVLSLTSSPKDIMNRLVAIANEVSQAEVKRGEENYVEFKKINRFETKSSLGFDVNVWDFESLVEELKEKKGRGFEIFYEQAYEQIKDKIERGEMNFPDGTMLLMEKIMDSADLTQPAVVISFAPPYYPAVFGGKNSQKAYDFVKEASKEFNVEVDFQNYFKGISDNSYTNMSFKREDLEIVKSATPLWGKVYSIDFDAIENVNVPAIIYGPVGRDYHKWAERVEKKSLFEVVPSVTRELIKKAWEF